MAGAKGELRLLVDLLSDEVDLTVVCDGKAVFLRTMRLGGGSPSLPALLAEIRLTMAAVQSQLAGRKVEAIVLCGQDEIHADLARSVEAELAMPVQLFDPFGGFERGPALRGLPLEHPGRFAPLLGMCQAELRQEGHAVDFLHPRRRAEAPNKRRKWIMAGSAVAALLLLYVVYVRVQHYTLACRGRDVAERNRERCMMPLLTPDTKKTRDAAAPIAKWVADERFGSIKLLALSEHFPPAQDAILYELTFVGAAERGPSRPERGCPQRGHHRQDGGAGACPRRSDCPQEAAAKTFPPKTIRGDSTRRSSWNGGGSHEADSAREKILAYAAGGTAGRGGRLLPLVCRRQPLHGRTRSRSRQVEQRRRCRTDDRRRKTSATPNG